MFDHSDDVKIVSSFRGQNKTNGKIESRKTHGFIFRIKGDYDYFFDGRRLRVNEGEFVFLPQGSMYEYQKASKGDGNLYTSINFLATVDDPQIRAYPCDIFYGIDYICQSFSETFTFGTVADRYKCLSLFYDLLSHIHTYEHLNDADKRKHDLIEPAIEYLKNHLFDSNLRIEKLPHLCGISDAYFRRIFASRFHIRPQEYVLAQRLSRAKSILESGDFDSIKEVSKSVGYNDPLYFSKAFKRFYGLSPSGVCKE